MSGLNDLFFWLGRLVIGSLFLCVFAALLIAYLWDYFRPTKLVIFLGTTIYCLLGTLLDLLAAENFGYGWQEQLVMLLIIGVIPYCAFFFLTRIPLPQYLYCLGSVSIQAFFISGLLETFDITQPALVTAPFLSALGRVAPLALLDTLIVITFRRFAASLFRENQSAEGWKRLMFAPLSGAAALGAFYYLTDFTTGNMTILFIFTACYIALFLSDVVALRSLSVSIRAAEAEARLESANRILASQKEQYKKLSDSIAQTRQARHDLRHHMNVISGMVQADDKESLRQYLAQYGQSLPNSDNAFYTGNYTADMIVGHYLSVAKQNRIHVDFNLRIPEACFIRDTDLCVLMGNCLENAIDACRKLPEEKRCLRVESAVKNKYLAITIANSYDGNTSMQDSAYLSDKRGRRDAGIGLESVEAVVRNYNGEMKIREENGVFTVYIMLKMLDKETDPLTRLLK